MKETIYLADEGPIQKESVQNAVKMKISLPQCYFLRDVCRHPRY